MITTVKTNINVATEKVWDIFAHDFDNAYVWMASIPISVGSENGPQHEGSSSAGRMCQLDGTPEGMIAKESFLAYNEEEKTCKILIDFLNTPFGFPLVKNVVDFSVIQDGKGRSDVTFSVTSTLKPLAYIIYPIVKFGFGFFARQIIEELKFYAENGTPHPRKVKANNKMKALQRPV